MEPHVAIVTGGAGGLGQAIARRLVHDGLLVATADLEATGAAGHERTMEVVVDVTDPASAQAMYAAVRERFGRVDVLVTGAGIAFPTASVSDHPPADWQRVTEVNLIGVFHCMKACLPGMLGRATGAW